MYFRGPYSGRRREAAPADKLPRTYPISNRRGSIVCASERGLFEFTYQMVDVVYVQAAMEANRFGYSRLQEPTSLGEEKGAPVCGSNPRAPTCQREGESPSLR